MLASSFVDSSDSASEPSTSGVVRVVLVDDHSLVRHGVRRILDDAAGLRVVAEFDSGEDLIRSAHALDAEVCVLDLTMPGMGGLEALSLLHDITPDLAVVVLSMQPAEAFAKRCYDAGALAYVSKGSGPGELVTAVRSAARGEHYVPADVAAVMVATATRQRAGASFDALSNREHEVLLRLVRGESVTEIGRALSLSVKTVSTHKTRMMRKLGLSSTADLVRFGIEHGLG